ncbi:SGNH/GDSL hydrolase family protein [Facilibium subflavum]|uniref:SGNH/GDSL hydrolase family protein n=1 Tax=Facilibium subflavum TaxID=2219058 RepID=UPI000E65BD5B|nr:SGNH/GDSL hydrolase family protein [Facilibium subflavum]
MRWEKLCCILCLAPAMVLAKAGINVYVNNNCHEPLAFIQEDTDSAKIDKQVTVAPYQVQLLNYVSTGYWFDTEVEKNIIIKDKSQQQIGHLKFRLENNWDNNQYQLKAIEGVIQVDNQVKSWHNWYGTPNITIMTCPIDVDFSQSPIFANASRVLIFGDSLSDKGTLFEYTQGIIPDDKHYYNGMFSNGDVWSWRLKNALKQDGISLSNYAIGGATAVLNPDLEHLPYSLDEEVNMFFTNAKLKNWQDFSRFPAIIWIGANDYLTEPANLSKQSIEYLTDHVVASIKANTIKLLDKGVSKFVFIGLPDLSKVPESVDDLHNTKITKALSQLHNQKLKQMVAELKSKYKGKTFIFIDITPLFKQMLENTELFNKDYHLNIHDVNNSCWQGGYTMENQQAYNTTLPRTADIKAALLVKEQGKLCSNPQNYLFWDRVHPTRQVQKIIYQVLITKLGAVIK